MSNKKGERSMTLVELLDDQEKVDVAEHAGPVAVHVGDYGDHLPLQIVKEPLQVPPGPPSS